MNELIERLEKAGPDRELDKLLAPFVGLRLVEESHPLGSCCYDQKGHGVPLPSFTASIDAALTLCPEGALYAIETYDSNGVYPEHVRASAWVQGAARAFAATPALAICIAALRAHSTGMEGNGNG